MTDPYGVPVVESSIVKRHSQSYTVDSDGKKVMGPFDLKPKEEAGKFYYGVRIITGTVGFAGTDASVFFTLIGNSASTKNLFILDGWEVLKGIDRSTYLDLVVETHETLDDIQVILLGNSGGGMQLGGDWFVDYIMTYSIAEKTEKMFPCYHWIGDKKTVSNTANTATLKDIKSNDVLVRERNIQLNKRKLQYKWLSFPNIGVPSGIDASILDLPLDQNFSLSKTIDFGKAGFEAAAKLGLTGLVISVDDLHDFVTLARAVEKPDFSLYQGSRWATDVEFGRQMLNGSNPVIIKKCTEKIPEKFPITDEMVGKFFTRQMTLKQEMEAGHIYICDMELMDGLTPRKGCFSPAPICLLYVNSSDKLVPIAIQLKQGLRDEEKDEPNPIFFPDDHWMDWLLAKIYYQAASSQYHQLCTHYFCCHAAMEAYGMATMRNLPDAHPVCKLLVPHFRYTMAINTAARATLINKNGIIDLSFGIGGDGKVEFFKKVSKAYSVDWTNIKKNLKARGLDDNPNQPPGYHWRDDGLKVWDVLETFVREVINIFYSNDHDVKNDTELAAWADDLYTTGFSSGITEGSPGHDFPQTIETKECLVEQCTRIMFTGSAQHSSINFLQNFIYCFVPNAPFAVRRPAPIKKGIADNQSLFNTLPDKFSAVLDLVLVYTLSRYSQDEVYLGKYPDERFTEPKIQQFIKDASHKLHIISEDIKERNKTLDVPYPYMDPPNITNSITI